MITTITLNPAIDKTYTATRMMPGQVNRMDSVNNIAGGKGVNVTKILRQYNYEVKALGFAGGYTGKFIEDSLKEMGAECYFTHVSGETRCNMNILSEDGYVTELLEPGPLISEAEIQNFLEEYQKVLKESELMIISGSVPRGVPVTIYGDLIKMAREEGKKVLLDTSGECLKVGVSSVPFMIKPNLKELEVLMGRKIKDREEAAVAALSLAEIGISHVMVSLGAKGLLYVHDKEIFYAKAPAVKVVNTVACGDSVVASFAMSLMEGEDKVQCLKKAAAISAANATTLKSAVIDKAIAHELYDTIVVERY